MSIILVLFLRFFEGMVPKIKSFASASAIGANPASTYSPPI